MTHALNEFWESNHYQHPDLTDEMLAIAQQQLAIKLPAEYIALLRIQNGGYTRGFGFPATSTTWSDDHVPLFALNGIVTDPDVSTALNILDTPYLTQEWGLPSKQVLLLGDGHWWITLDYRQGTSPSVAWLDVERDQDLRLAESFAEFLEGLLPIEEFERDDDS